MNEIRGEAKGLDCRFGDVEFFGGPAPLSLVRAAERFDLDPHTLAKAAAKKRVPGRRGKGRGPAGVEWKFDERKLGEKLRRLTCGYKGCERRALGPSGGCEDHGHALMAMETKRPAEV